MRVSRSTHRRRRDCKLYSSPRSPSFLQNTIPSPRCARDRESPGRAASASAEKFVLDRLDWSRDSPRPRRPRRAPGDRSCNPVCGEIVGDETDGNIARGAGRMDAPPAPNRECACEPQAGISSRSRLLDAARLMKRFTVGGRSGAFRAISSTAIYRCGRTRRLAQAALTIYLNSVAGMSEFVASAVRAPRSVRPDVVAVGSLGNECARHWQSRSRRAPAALRANDGLNTAISGTACIAAVAGSARGGAPNRGLGQHRRLIRTHSACRYAPDPPSIRRSNRERMILNFGAPRHLEERVEAGAVPAHAGQRGKRIA